ncbi:MAG: diadenylate cyclase CdaA [Spirochaetales bacterium]|nr:diadenylate cyclase CdaA [Spirochaetales bacterium]MBP5706163.1 diadenylate cyclase CdaA [Spirochaetales bacterium]
MVWLYAPLIVKIINILFTMLDIFLISALFYGIYRILSGTKGVQVIIGVVAFVVLYVIVRIFQLHTCLWLMNQIAGVLAIALIVLFQPEIREVLSSIGKGGLYFNRHQKADKQDLEEILKSVDNFSILHTGAIIVFERKDGLKKYIKTGTTINAKISAPLIIAIFGCYHEQGGSVFSPLHDGAVIIRNSKIAAAGCYLPVSGSTQISRDLGTRHRAALGMAEETDAVVVVVSEETGKISVAKDGKLYTNYDIESLRDELTIQLGYADTDEEEGEDEN